MRNGRHIGAARTRSFQTLAIAALLRGEGKHLLDMLPIDQIVEPCLEIFRPEISIVDVISVLPDVAAKQRPAAVNERVLAVRGLGDLELAVLRCKPAPA